MKFPWANALLLAFIFAELVTGFFGLVSGSPDRAILIQTHRVAGYGIILVLLWKTGNVAFSLRWPRAAASRAASLVLAVLLLVTLTLGLAWSSAGPFQFLRLSGVSWHIYFGAALVPVLAWHSRHHTRGLPLTFWADRRQFLRLAGLAVAGLGLWQLAEMGVRSAGLRGSTRRFTGSYGSTRLEAAAFPVVSWLNDRPTPVDPDRWSLAIKGEVERETVLGYKDLASESEMTATIDCTGGWYSTQEWSGVPVSQLLALSAPSPEAASVTVRSVTGYSRRFSMDEIDGFLLATHVGGRRLSHGHGSPARLVAPGKRGFEWVKWVESIEVNKTPRWLQPPLPLQ